MGVKASLTSTRQMCKKTLCVQRMTICTADAILRDDSKAHPLMWPLLLVVRRLLRGEPAAVECRQLLMEQVKSPICTLALLRIPVQLQKPRRAPSMACGSNAFAVETFRPQSRK